MRQGSEMGLKTIYSIMISQISYVAMSLCQAFWNSQNGPKPKTYALVRLVGLVGPFFMVKSSNKVFKNSKKCKNYNNKKRRIHVFDLFMSGKLFKCMQELPKSHRNYFSWAIILGSVHPTEENILQLNNIDMSN